MWTILNCCTSRAPLNRCTWTYTSVEDKFYSKTCFWPILRPSLGALQASFCTAKTSLLFYFPSIRGRSDTLRSIRSNILLSQILLLHGNTALENKLSVSLLQIYDADTRREHKLTAGVSLIRWGLICAQQRSRCVIYLQKERLAQKLLI